MSQHSVSFDDACDHKIDLISLYKPLDRGCFTQCDSSTDRVTLPRNSLRTFKRKQNDVEARADSCTQFETIHHESRITVKKTKNTFPDLGFLFKDRAKQSTNESPKSPSKKKDHSIIIGPSHSLAYQLDCLSKDCFTTKCQDKERKINPLLPSVISNSSNSSSDSNGNTSLQVMHSRISSSSDHIRKRDESEASDDEGQQYGWFVDLTVDTIESNESLNNHSHQEYVTDRSNNLDAQVEWAQAADTVDEVLSDFFN